MYETFSKREKKRMGQVKDVYIYDKIPDRLRVQVIHIWGQAIGESDFTWGTINQIMSKELGEFNLTEENCKPKKHCIDFLLSCKDIYAIDIIELSFCILKEQYEKGAISIDPFLLDLLKIGQSFDEAIKELNHWFKDNSIGYEFINGEIIRIDQTYMHEEVVKPAINLLFEEDFEGAAEEFLNAHKAYRKDDYKTALVEALKSFESTMKTICDKRNLTYNKASDTARKLITILFENNIIPGYLNNHFTSLRTTLESGLPTVRNKQAGHGQGSESVKVDPYFVEYAINLAATNIILLVKAYKESK
ncbi:STM4504/CBY_0614 family protein [Bacillus toyonensis]|uniref:STM4504/CBY_0614 family protein n=1 Tax=Bacillus toyonensis TaxID=155322 RepID=UPI000BEB629E|nr:hypothetical protein [Bacillus toyonensis]PEF77690.1 hypothetical protein CON80_30210 [Bacillus toyonensis]